MAADMALEPKRTGDDPLKESFQALAEARKQFEKFPKIVQAVAEVVAREVLLEVQKTDPKVDMLVVEKDGSRFKLKMVGDTRPSARTSGVLKQVVGENIPALLFLGKPEELREIRIGGEARPAVSGFSVSQFMASVEASIDPPTPRMSKAEAAETLEAMRFWTLATEAVSSYVNATDVGPIVNREFGGGTVGIVNCTLQKSPKDQLYRLGIRQEGYTRLYLVGKDVNRESMRAMLERETTGLLAVTLRHRDGVFPSYISGLEIFDGSEDGLNVRPVAWNRHQRLALVFQGGGKGQSATCTWETDFIPDAKLQKKRISFINLGEDAQRKIAERFHPFYEAEKIHTLQLLEMVRMQRSSTEEVYRAYKNAQLTHECPLVGDIGYIFGVNYVLVEEGVNGFLFKSFDGDSLATKSLQTIGTNGQYRTDKGHLITMFRDEAFREGVKFDVDYPFKPYRPLLEVLEGWVQADVTHAIRTARVILEEDGRMGKEILADAIDKLGKYYIGSIQPVDVDTLFQNAHRWLKEQVDSGITVGNVSRVLDEMFRKGLIAKDEAGMITLAADKK
jgi:hypothetical protein